jgi:hypothetical protein
MSNHQVEEIEGREFKFDQPVAERLKNPRQQFTVLSVIAPTGTSQKAKDLMIRVYGCCETMEQANTWAKQIRDSNDFFDVYVLQNHEWAPLPPNCDEVDFVSYTEKRVQDIRDSYISHLKGEKRAMIERLDQDEQERKNKELARKERKKALKRYYDRKRRPKVPIDQIPLEYRRRCKKTDAGEMKLEDSDFSDGGADADDETKDEGAEESKN